MALVNRNADPIPLVREEHLIASSSLVRQARDYLQPIPMALGAVLGFLLFGIVGVFRKGKRAVDVHPTSASPYVQQKQL